MVQPTPDALTLNAVTEAGGDDLWGDLISAMFAQGILVGYSTGDGTANFVTADTGLPVAQVSGEEWAITLAELPDTAAGDLAAMVVDLAAIESLLTTIDADTSRIPTLGQAAMAASSPVVIASNQSAVPVSGPLTDTELRATAVPVSGTVTASGPLTDTELRATAVPVSGTFWQATQPISVASLPLPTGAATESTISAINGKVTACNTGAVVIASGSVGLTGNLPDTAAGDLAAMVVDLAAIEVLLGTIDADTSRIPSLGQAAMAASSPVVIASNQSAVPVSGPLTNAELRATAVPVSGTVTASGPLTDTELRATAVPVSGTFWQATQPISAASLPLPTDAATQTTLAALNTQYGAIGDASNVAGSVHAQLRYCGTNISAVNVNTGYLVYAVGPEGMATTSLWGQIMAGDNAGTIKFLAVDSSGRPTVNVNGTVTVGSHAVTNAGTFVVQENGAALTALQIIDDWDESDRAKVNLIVGQAGIAAGAGAVGATVPRVTLASDDPAVAKLTTIDADTSSMAGCVAGTEVQVDIVAALPAGTNAIGKLAANSGVDIGDVDVTSIAAGTNTIGGVIAQQSTSVAYDGTTACTIKRFHSANPSDGDSLIAAVADKKFRVLSFGIISISGTICRFWLDDADAAAVFGNSTGFALEEDSGAASPGFVLNHNPGGWFQTATANKALRIQFASGSGVVVFGTYIEVA